MSCLLRVAPHFLWYQPKSRVGKKNKKKQPLNLPIKLSESYVQWPSLGNGQHLNLFAVSKDRRLVGSIEQVIELAWPK